MQNYCIEKDSTITDYEKTKRLLYFSKIKIKREEKELIKRISRNNFRNFRNKTLFNKTSMSKVSSTDNMLTISKKPCMNISIPKETFYYSPLHSLGVLKLNSVIHSDIIKTNLDRQKLLYKDSIKLSENIKTHILTKMPKIKISRITPKFVNIPIINRINNSNNKDEEKVESDNDKNQNDDNNNYTEAHKKK
jgi:hypothetical protein